MNKIKKLLIPFYIIFILTGFFLINESLKESSIEAREQKEEKKVIKKEPVEASLVVDFTDKKEIFKIKLDDQTSVLSMLEELRLQENLFFEITEYSYGLEIDVVNDIKSNSENKWKIIADGKDITNKIDDINLEKNKTYTLVYQ